MPVVQLTPEILADHFSEKWQTMIDTPERILGDLRTAIDWGMRQKHIPLMAENPAQIKDGRLGDLLPLKRPKKRNQPALAPNEIPDFFAVLANAIPMSQSALALAYTILTAARNSTARESSWDEIIVDDPDQGEFRRVTPHGVARASFKTWGNDAAGYNHPEFQRSTLESCLDHRHEKYANAYDREQALGDMRRVFDAWGEFCFSKLTDEQKKKLGL